MFKLGESIIGNYKLWITTGVYGINHDHPKALDQPYYNVLLTQMSGLQFYVNPIKEDWLNLNLSDRNPLAKPKDKENPTDDEKEFQDEFRAWEFVKNMGMPLIKLSKRHVFQLLELLFLKKGEVITICSGLIMDKGAMDKILVPGAEMKLRAVFDALEPISTLSTEKDELSWNEKTLEERVRTCIEVRQLPFKEVMQAVRVAITGRTESPPLFASIALIGKKETLNRLQIAANYAESRKP